MDKKSILLKLISFYFVVDLINYNNYFGSLLKWAWHGNVITCALKISVCTRKRVTICVCCSTRSEVCSTITRVLTEQEKGEPFDVPFTCLKQ